MNDEKFLEFVNSFRDLSSDKKKEEIIKELKSLTAVFVLLCEKSNIKYEKFDLNEINKSIESIDEDETFLNKTFTYIEILKEMIGYYLDK